MRALCPQAWATTDLFQTLWFCLFSHFIPSCRKWSLLCPLPSLLPQWDVHVRKENGGDFRVGAHHQEPARPYSRRTLVQTPCVFPANPLASGADRHTEEGP